VINFLEKITDDYQYITKAGNISTYVNPFQYIKLRSIENIDRKIDHFFFDGMLIPRILFLLGFRKVSVMQPDLSGFINRLFLNASIESKSVYIIGSSEDNVESAVKKIRDEFSDLFVIGFRGGFFASQTEYLSAINHIVKIKPNYVLVGMGAVYQENFLIDLKEKDFKGCGIACGGFIHQTANKTNYYPKFFRKLNIRWAYRIIDEPKLLYRYFVIYPFSLVLIIYDYYNNRRKKIFECD
jgi:N-acetylglucosaminyldiphosphoundecaprenol N-acetyl-beta-D-mannosaminyltransferase